MISQDDYRYSWTRQRMLVEIERQEQEINVLNKVTCADDEDKKSKKLNAKRLYKAQMLIAKVSASI